jgi:DNA-directed RNA polymerase specialized sigma24 family protein
LREYREGTNFVSWGLTIAKYKVFQFIRKNKRTDFILNQSAETGGGNIACQVVIVAGTVDVLKECVSKLGREKKMLQMRYEQN